MRGNSDLPPRLHHCFLTAPPLSLHPLPSLDSQLFEPVLGTQDSPGAKTVKHLPTVRDTWAWSLGWEDPLEKEMATHSSTLAWKIPWMEETGGLQSMGSQSWTWLNDFTWNSGKGTQKGICAWEPHRVLLDFSDPQKLQADTATHLNQSLPQLQKFQSEAGGWGQTPPSREWRSSQSSLIQFRHCCCWVTKAKVKVLNRFWLFATPWTVAYQAPPSMGFSGQECWSGVPLPSPGDCPDPGIDPRSKLCPTLPSQAL